MNFALSPPAQKHQELGDFNNLPDRIYIHDLSHHGLNWNDGEMWRVRNEPHYMPPSNYIDIYGDLHLCALIYSAEHQRWAFFTSSNTVTCWGPKGISPVGKWLRSHDDHNWSSFRVTTRRNKHITLILYLAFALLVLIACVIFNTP